MKSLWRSVCSAITINCGIACSITHPGRTQHHQAGIHTYIHTRVQTCMHTYIHSYKLQCTLVYVSVLCCSIKCWDCAIAYKSLSRIAEHSFHH